MRRSVRALVVRDNGILVMHRNKFGSQYYTLVGGGIQAGETPDRALVREVAEETGLSITSARLVFTEDGGDLYGAQYIYLCEVQGDQPVLSASTEEAQINKLGKNLYTPMWLPLEDFASCAFRSSLLQQAILLGLKHGFPAQPIVLDAAFLEKVQSNVVTK